LRTVLSTALVLTSAVGLAQQPGQSRAPERRTAGDDSQANTSAAHTDAQLAACLIIDQQKEIALAQFASQQSKNEQVQAFAQKMIRDHQQFAEELQAIAAAGGFQLQQLTVTLEAVGAQTNPSRGLGNQNPDSPREAREARRAARAEQRVEQRDETGERPAASGRSVRIQVGAAGGVDFVGLKHELAKQCLESARQELEQKTEAEFDKCYIGSQVMAHMAMVDALTVFSRHASPEFQQTIEHGLQTTQSHLSEAKKLAQQFEKSPGSEPVTF
ncbi:MAG: DUF4142 domain-containing protein, partial [Planctomycetaceae bacterium]